MRTVQLTDEETAALLSIAEKLKRAKCNDARHAKTVARDKFIDAHPSTPQRQLAMLMKTSGLYSAATFSGDIERHIVKRREGRL
jgi:hypothetical protein